MSLVITGATGFLGWHVRVLARALGLPEPVIIENLQDTDRLAVLLNGADRVIHLAGVNRGEVSGNVDLARALAMALGKCKTPPKTVVYANSIKAGNGTPYGDAKATAATLLAEATQWSGSAFRDPRLPNLFGEHGRPHYNSVIATFSRLLADGEAIRIEENRELQLLHASDAAALLLGIDGHEAPVRRTVQHLADQLTHFATLYRGGEIPELHDRFDVHLFNTYRSHCAPGNPLRLARHADERGDLIEAVKAHGGGGQTYFSSTLPGGTRGEHFHLTKVERFLVLRGEAEICLRRVLHDEVIRLHVSGTEPLIVDMPTMWAHNITNVGEGELLTLFWSNEVFDPDRPDTYLEPVALDRAK